MKIRIIILIIFCTVSILSWRVLNLIGCCAVAVFLIDWKPFGIWFLINWLCIACVVQKCLLDDLSFVPGYCKIGLETKVNYISESEFCLAFTFFQLTNSIKVYDLLYSTMQWKKKSSQFTFDYNSLVYDPNPGTFIILSVY